MKKKALWLIFIFFIGMLLSSCSMLNNISTKVIGKDSDIKLNSGIINGNLEQVKEAIEDGANINKMDIPLASEKNPVILAMTKNQDRIAEYLINNGIDENYVDTTGRSLLMFSAYNTNIKICELLIKYGAKINQEDERGYTALEYVLEHSRKDTTEETVDEIFTVLLNNGAKIRPITLKAALNGGDIDGESRYGLIKRVLEKLINECEKSGLEPIMEAAILGESSIVEGFVKAGKLKKQNEEQVLFYTSIYGKVETIKLLETRGLSLKSRDKLNNTLLILASQYGNLEIVKYLMDKGTDIEAENKEGETALMAAVIRNQYDIAECLMKKGAKPIYGDGPRNILIDAARNGDIKMIRLIFGNNYPLSEENFGKALVSSVVSNKTEAMQFLLNNGANIDSTYGSEALVDACLRGNLEAVKFLVEHGVKINGKDSDGMPLQTAAKFGKTEVVKYLIEKGVDVNAVSKYDDGSRGESSLMAASYSGQFDIVKLLVENGADINFQNESAALFGAASQGSRHIVEYLIQKGAEINYQNSKGQTALMQAAYWGWLDNVKVLIKYKADASVRDKEGHTALDLAKASKHIDVADYLENIK